MNRKKALVTGVTGQDGAYLVEHLLNLDYEVHGVKRRSSVLNTQRIDHLYQDPHEPDQRLILHYGDLADSSNIIRLIQEIEPDEIYNIGAMSHVRVSFDIPEYTADVDGLGALRILEAIRILGKTDKIRFYQASSSELYGLVQEVPQSERTPFYPRSPYGVAKLYAYWITVNYRESYGMYACNGILFNHESPLRGETFVTRKITQGVSRIAHGLQDTLFLGNLDAERDWGHAKDYVVAMHLMLQQDEPEDFVIATGQKASVRDFVRSAFEHVGATIDFKGEGQGEIGYVSKYSGTLPGLDVDKQVIRIDPQYYRPAEVDELLGDSSNARKKLGWEPQYDLTSLIKEMMEHDLKLSEEEEHLNGRRKNNGSK